MSFKRVLLEYFIIMLLAFIPILALHKFDKELEKSENFTCGEAIGRHHNQTGVIHYAPDDWIDEVFWMECRFRRKWPEGYRDGFDIKLKELEDQKFTKAKIRVLERIIRKKEEKDGTR